MEGKGFQVSLRGLTPRSGATRGTRAGEGRHRRQPCSALRMRERGGGFARYGAGSAALPVQGLRQDLQRAERYAAVGLAPQGTLARSGRRSKGETVKASAARCESTAFRWRHRFLAAARSDSAKGIVEADVTYVLESRKGARGLGRKARRRGGKAKKRASGAGHGGGPERDDGQRGAAQGRCGGARGCPRSGGREGRPAGLRRRRELPTCAAALGVSHEAPTARWGNGFGAICMCRR